MAKCWEDMLILGLGVQDQLWTSRWELVTVDTYVGFSFKNPHIKENGETLFDFWMTFVH